MNYYQNRNPLANIPPVIKNLLMINAVMLFATYVIGDAMYEKLGLFYPASPFFRPYQYISHMFMHGNLMHLFFNMYALWIFGCALEYVWGSKRFLLFYMATGLGAAAFHTFVLWLTSLSMPAFSLSYHQMLMTPTVGASGAIYGVLLGYGMLFPNNVLQLIFPPVALKAKWFVLILGALALLLGVTGRGGNVAHFAHLGGMIFAYLLIRGWRNKNRMYF
ncbi:MAG: rhomboid family intramembrane serine protease [Bacteroidales bacterium]|nr:rhomboid family intramembrane serine protease [Bacteroidales bacterium]MCL2738613.1 rhomboid family intramembrane serine protease [Bacteroidales bacterium]